MPAPAGGASRDATSAGRPAAPATITVHVVGAVRRPGVYVLPGRCAGHRRGRRGGRAAGQRRARCRQPGARGDRRRAAGRTRPRGGGCRRPAGTAAATGGGAGAATGGPVDLNTATIEQLDALPGIGPATAQKIVADRTENGPFRSVDDLLRVTGIGAKKLDALKDLVTVR